MERYFVLIAPQDGGTVGAALKAGGLSSTRVKKAKRLPGGITRNGEPVWTNQPVRRGDVLRVLLQTGEEASPVPPSPGGVDLVYEDEDLLILNKPAGVPVHPSPGHWEDSLASRLAGSYARLGQAFVFRPVNRLDKGTTGLMAVAKDAHIHAQLSKQLAVGELVRTYLAVTAGAPQPEAGAVDAPIGRLAGSAIARCVREDGARAVTHYQTLRRYGGVALVRLWLKTGRTHQVRVHMAYIGQPLVGDFLYGVEERGRIARPALHSARLSLRQPHTGEALHFVQPLPEDMRALLQKEEDQDD